MKFLLPVLLMLVVAAFAIKPRKVYPPPIAEGEESLLEKRVLSTHVDVTCAPNQFMCVGVYGICIWDTWVCDGQKDCPGGSDERNCPANCDGDNQFDCGDGTCIPVEYQCDRNIDCPDEIDEINCHKHTCSPGRVQCDNYVCVQKGWFCDGGDDCGDGYDERNCTQACPLDQWSCRDKSKCIKRSDICNGKLDCQDSSDETYNCDCQRNQFRCKSGRCISENFKCNSKNDCGDWSDESVCNKLHPTLCHDLMTGRDCAYMNETADGAICLDKTLGFDYCRQFCGLCTHT